MKINIKKVDVSLEKRKEMQEKILNILEEYQAPILIAYKLKIIDTDSKEPMLSFSEEKEEDNKKQVHIVKDCTFVFTMKRKLKNVEKELVKMSKSSQN